MTSRGRGEDGHDRTRRTHVILANVHALAPHGQRYVHTVVDQQRDAELLGERMELPRGGDKNARVARLVAVLHHGRPAPQRGLDDGHERPVAEDGGRRVRDEVERVVDGWL